MILVKNVWDSYKYITSEYCLSTKDFMNKTMISADEKTPREKYFPGVFSVICL